MALTRLDAETLDELEELTTSEYGVNIFQLNMAGKHMLNDSQMLDAMEKVGRTHFIFGEAFLNFFLTFGYFFSILSLINIASSATSYIAIPEMRELNPGCFVLVFAFTLGFIHNRIPLKPCKAKFNSLPGTHFYNCNKTVTESLKTK